MDKFKISVIIPTYNRENFIEKCIESVLSSNDENIEIIIVDNASTDNTNSKIQKYKKNPCIKIFTNNTNLERSYSRNLGFIKSTGKFVTLLDSDDVLDKNIFKEFRNFYSKNKNYNIYFANFRICNLASNVYKTNILHKNTLNLKTLSKGNYLSNICVFFKKSITENINFDENPKIIGIEDYDFNLRAIFLYGNAKKFSNNFLGTVTDHCTRSVNIDNIEKAEQRFIFFKNKIFYHKDFHKFNILIKYRVLSTSSLYLALICVKNKNKFKSLKYLYISLIYNFKIITEKRFYYIIFKLIFTL